MVSRSSKLSVLMNGVLIGLLEKSDKGLLKFTYDETWLSNKGARPVSLSMPLAKKSHEGYAVYNFFDNLLPDNKQIRARIQRKFKSRTNEPFDLLASIGKDCVGAVQVLDSDFSEFKKEILARPLKENEIAKILKGYQEFPLGMTVDEDDFRISIAGAQEKTAFLFHENKWCHPISTTPTSHIFKLPIGVINNYQPMDLSDSCENEWLCSRIAQHFGFSVAGTKILNFEDVKVLSVERFDRQLSKDGSWIMRLPQEDICQALGVSPNIKYQSDGGPGIKDIMKLLLGSSVANEDRDNFYRAQVLFWLLAAIDGHAKNFSLFIEPQGKYRLTPLYDIMSAFPFMAKQQLRKNKIKMAMALRGRNNHYHWYHMQKRYFLGTAKFANYSQEKADSIIDEMLNKVSEVIEIVSSEIPDDFPRIVSDSILDGLYKASQNLKWTG